MEQKLYNRVYQLVTRISNITKLKRATYTDAQILLVYLWAVLHDRPIYWACDKKNWPVYLRRQPLPWPSTMTRRLRTERIQVLMKEIETYIRSKLPSGLCKWIDSKPLPVGRHTKDKNAGFGSAAGLMAAGYKLHVIADSRQGFAAWVVRPMNESESKIAQMLIPQLSGYCYLIGDRAYDSNKLYDLCADCGVQLITPQRRKNARGFGHRHNSRYRMRAMHLKDTTFGQSLLDNREQIERMFGRLTSFCCGLSPLPSWVRTLHRVEMWVRAKLIFYQIWSTQLAPTAA